MQESDTTAGTSAADDLALFRRAPLLADGLPRIRLGVYPTVVELVEIAGRPILVKRDDVCAAGYAGNKVRKLEFLLADALQRGSRRIITAGATGSHHALATAYHARRLGLDASLVLFPQSLTPHVRDVLLMAAGTGAELRWAPRMEAVPFATLRARFGHRAAAPCTIPPGGSNAIGAVGYVSAALELAEQIATGVVPVPCRIHVAAGTLGTVAGIAIGLAWAGLDVPVAATRITARIVTNERVLASLVRSTLARLRAAGADPPAVDAALRLVELRHDQIGAGYGRSTAAGREATELFAAAGLRLDDTYTAKAAADLLAAPPSNAPPLFWHTLSAVEPRELIDNGTVLPPAFVSYLERAQRTS